MTDKNQQESGTDWIQGDDEKIQWLKNALGIEDWEDGVKLREITRLLEYKVNFKWESQLVEFVHAKSKG